MTVAVVASRIGIEEKEIVAAVERHGVPVIRIHTSQWVAQLDDGPAPWRVVVNREISLTRSRYVAHTVEAAGVRAINSAHAVTTCGDKWLTALALRSAGVPTPATALALTPAAGLAAAERLGYPVVLKPLVSSHGRRVSLARDPEAVSGILETCAAMPSPQAQAMSVQEYVADSEDVRVLVVGRRAVAAMYRRGDDWRRNLARGAEPEPCPVDDDLAKMALAAADAVGAEIAGVDVLVAGDGNRTVLEVNHNPQFAGLQRAVPDASIAAAVADLVTTGDEWR